MPRNFSHRGDENIGDPADSAVTDPASSANVIQLLKGSLTQLQSGSGSTLTSDTLRTYPDDVVFRPTITTSDTAYTTGDVIGGILTLSAAGTITLGNSTAAGSARLKSIALKDDKNQKPDLVLLFFRSSPAGMYTDNATVAPSTADMGNLIHAHVVAAGDWLTIPGTSKAVVSYTYDDGPILQPASADLFLVIVAGTAAPDYGANTTDLTAEIGLTRSA